jgi:hypothetical protein
MCTHFSVGLTLLSHHLWNRTTPLSPGVTACLKQDDFAETCGQKSIFPLLAKNSTEGGATQLSLRLGHSDWPVKRSKPPPQDCRSGGGRKPSSSWSNDVDRAKELVFPPLGPFAAACWGISAYQRATTAGRHRAKPFFFSSVAFFNRLQRVALPIQAGASRHDPGPTGAQPTAKQSHWKRSDYLRQRLFNPLARNSCQIRVPRVPGLSD